MAAQRHYDLALHGHGLIPGLLCLHLLRRASLRSLLLLSADTTVAGNALEPVTLSSLSPPALDLVEDFAVARWPGYLVIRDGQSHRHDDPVLLLDPVQLLLELGTELAAHNMRAGVRSVSRRGTALAWQGGTAQAADLVDLCALTRTEQCTQILGLDVARGLDLPVLADLDTRDEQWNALQHVPLGDERIYVRKRRCRGDPEFELTRGFGKLLSELVAY